MYGTSKNLRLRVSDELCDGTCGHDGLNSYGS
jgi:hypothetical protein